MADDVTNYRAAAPDPAPELEKLGFLAGEWQMEGTIKANPFGPGGKIKGRHTWKLMEGGFFWEHRWGQELGIGVEYIGYDEPNKRFFTHYFDNNGPYDEEGSTYEGEMRGDSYML